MVTARQRSAARRNVKKAARVARKQRSIAHLPKKTRTALGKQGAAVRKRRQEGAATPKTKAELLKLARRRGLEGRSKLGRDELARALGES